MESNKKCANPKCPEHFKGTNPKKRFCNLACKNQAAYWHRQKIYDWEVSLQKERLVNIQILERLYKRRIYTVNGIELRKMGFNPKAAFVPDVNSERQQVYRFGNLYLIGINEREFNIQKVQLNKDK